MEKVLDRSERTLYECALAVEKDESLCCEMKEWDVTLNDGIKKDES